MVEEDPGAGVSNETPEAVSHALARLTTRVSNLRVGVSEVMRHTWPEQARGVEKAAGIHLSQMPDTLLVGYLSAFSELSRSGDALEAPSMLDEVSRAMRDAGLEVPEGATAVDVAVAIREQVGALRSRLKKAEDARPKPRRKKSPIEKQMTWAAGDEGETVGDPVVDDRDELPDNLRDAVTSILEVPAPRFMCDVVAALGSTTAAAKWETALRSNKAMAVIPPQSKWKDRGALLIPQDAMRQRIANFDNSPWGRAVNSSIRGGRLFELALVLRSMEGKILAASYRPHTAELTTRTPQGVSGFIVGLSAGADPWVDVEKGVREMGRAGITQVTVIVSPVAQADSVVGTLQAAAASDEWDSSQAVVRVVTLPEWLMTGEANAAVALGG